MKMPIADKLEFFGIHPKYEASLLRTGGLLLILAVIQLAAWLLPAWPDFKGIPYYLTLHIFLEAISIIVSMMVFAVGWNSRSPSLSGNVILLASVFFSVGLLDFSHTVSYGGMPDFISPNDAQKHLNFWLSARFFAAAVLLVIAIRPWKPLASAVTHYLIFGSLLVVTLVINWVVIYHQSWLPDTFIQGQGLTTIKKNVEYVIIVINLITAILLWLKMREPQSFNVVLLFGAACTLAMSEFYFTLYTTMTGSYNVLGHIYKVIAYLFIYRAIVVEVIEEPYNLLKVAKNEIQESETRFRRILEHAPIGIVTTNLDGQFIKVNEAFCHLLGYAKVELEKLSFKDITHPADNTLADNERQKLLNGEIDSYRLEKRYIHKDGHVIWIQLTSSIEKSLQGAPFFIAQVEDISERKKAELDFRRYKSILQTAHDGFWILNSNGFLQVVNQAYADISGYTVDELQGMHITQLEGMEQTEEETKAHMATIINRGYELFETRHRHKDGHLIDIEVSTSFIPELQQFVAFCRDISERKAADEKIEQLAFYDPLTHLPNLNLLISRLQKIIEVSINQQKFNAILLINIDDFKSLNDFKGREVGDLFLIELTDHLKSSVHSTDIIARIGGDEFAVVIDLLSDAIDAATLESSAVAERIIAKINQPLDLRGYAYHCTVSIGVTLFRTDELTVQQLLKRANVAMHRAKRQGRNSVSFFDPATEVELESRAKLESWMHSALNGQYRLHYQIQVDDNGKAIGAEALIRWQHPERGMIYPAEFIPLAEETGLIIPIGTWVLEAACLQLKAWQDDPKFKHLVLAVNVSAKQFHQPDFLNKVLTVLDQTGVDADKLKLELTESIFVDNVDDLIVKMNLLKSRGVRFSLDDFGTGYSSLSILKRLPLNQLKIDQSFVRNLLNDPNDAAIIRTVIALGQSFGVEVIAEGVETIEQRNLLAVYGCQYFQGYLFSKPLPLGEFEAIVQ